MQPTQPMPIEEPLTAWYAAQQTNPGYLRITGKGKSRTVEFISKSQMSRFEKIKSYLGIREYSHTKVLDFLSRHPDLLEVRYIAKAYVASLEKKHIFRIAPKTEVLQSIIQRLTKGSIKAAKEKILSSARASPTKDVTATSKRLLTPEKPRLSEFAVASYFDVNLVTLRKMRIEEQIRKSGPLTDESFFDEPEKQLNISKEKLEQYISDFEEWEYISGQLDKYNGQTSFNDNDLHHIHELLKAINAHGEDFHCSDLVQKLSSLEQKLAHLTEEHPEIKKEIETIKSRGFTGPAWQMVQQQYPSPTNVNIFQYIEEHKSELQKKEWKPFQELFARAKEAAESKAPNFQRKMYRALREEGAALNLQSNIVFGKILKDAIDFFLPLNSAWKRMETEGQGATNIFDFIEKLNKEVPDSPKHPDYPFVILGNKVSNSLNLPPDKVREELEKNLADLATDPYVEAAFNLSSSECKERIIQQGVEFSEKILAAKLQGAGWEKVRKLSNDPLTKINLFRSIDEYQRTHIQDTDPSFQAIFEMAREVSDTSGASFQDEMNTRLGFIQPLLDTPFSLLDASVRSKILKDAVEFFRPPLPHENSAWETMAKEAPGETNVFAYIDKRIKTVDPTRTQSPDHPEHPFVVLGKKVENCLTWSSTPDQFKANVLQTLIELSNDPYTSQPFHLKDPESRKKIYEQAIAFFEYRTEGPFTFSYENAEAKSTGEDRFVESLRNEKIGEFKDLPVLDSKPMKILRYTKTSQNEIRVSVSELKFDDSILSTMNFNIEASEIKGLLSDAVQNKESKYFNMGNGWTARCSQDKDGVYRIHVEHPFLREMRTRTPITKIRMEYYISQFLEENNFSVVWTIILQSLTKNEADKNVLDQMLRDAMTYPDLKKRAIRLLTSLRALPP